MARNKWLLGLITMLILSLILGACTTPTAAPAPETPATAVPQPETPATAVPQPAASCRSTGCHPILEQRLVPIIHRW